jgi:anti-sigma B factor antagonist
MTNTEFPVRRTNNPIPAQSGLPEIVKPNPTDLAITLGHSEDGVPVLRVSGEIDMRTAPALRLEVEQAIARRPMLILDLTGVEFLASAGLSILIELARRAPETGLRWGAVATGRAVLRPLEAVGLLTVIPVYPTVSDAVAAVNAGQP